MSEWRLIDTDLNHPYYVTAAEEAICKARAQDLVPDTLHFYRRDPPGVSVGYFNKVEEEVNIAACKENNVAIVRRMTGGGTIFTDKNQLIFSIITKRQLGSGIENTFEMVCNGIIDMLKKFDIQAEYKPPNDVLLNGKKISGSAQTLKKDVVLLHGTILLSTDLELMQKVLKHVNLDYISTIKQELVNIIPTIEEIKSELVKSFNRSFMVKIHQDNLNQREIKMTKILINDKYNTTKWNFKR
jgi:lipoate-protein ligase A